MTNFEHKMVLVEYSEKAVAMVGDTKEHKEDLKAMGGKFNVKLVLEGKGLKTPYNTATVGWIFPKTEHPKLLQYLKDGRCISGEPTVQSKRLLTRKVDSKREAPCSNTSIVLTRAVFYSILERISSLEREVNELKQGGSSESNITTRRAPTPDHDDDYDFPTKPLRLLRAKK